MKRYIIPESSTIVEGLRMLNDISGSSMTLFVVDEGSRLVGTLTDGDIRRSLIAGAGLEDCVSGAMNRSYSFVSDRYDVERIRELRKREITLVPVLDAERHLVAIMDLTECRSSLPVEAVLMAGGRGERLRPLTLDCPKPLLKIGDRAIIDRNIDRLAEFGIKHITVTVNYLKEQLIDHFRKCSPQGVEIECVAEERFLGTIGSLSMIKDPDQENILVMNSDLLTDINYEDFFIHFKRNNAMMSAAAIPYTISIPYGIFDLEGRDIKGVTEKPTYSLYANAGIYLLRKQVLKYIPKGKFFNATDLIDTLVKAGEKVVRFPLTGLWVDIGTPDEYRKACDIARNL